VADSQGHAVCGIIGGGRNLELEDHPHHLLHLLLLGPAVANHRLLDLHRRVLKDVEATVSGSQHRYAACLADADCSVHVLAEEQFLD